MKKLIALLLALVMVLSMAACAPANNNEETEGNNDVTEGNENKETEAPAAASALELLETVWAKFPEANKFPVMGGDEANANYEGPGKVELPGAEGNALWSLYVPEEQLANFSEAATMMHAMNANTFTAGALKLADGADKTAVAKALSDAILGTHWMCGFPERLIVVSVDNYLVVAFGHDGVNFPEGGKIITEFLTGLQAEYASAAVLHDEAIG